METLLGGRTITVNKEDSSTEEVKVRQLPLREYEKAFLVYDDEFAFAALVCERSKEWAQTLSPESYEELASACQEVNAKGFFSYAQRQQKKLMDRLNSVKPEVLRMAVEKASNASPPGLRPHAG